LRITKRRKLCSHASDLKKMAAREQKGSNSPYSPNFTVKEFSEVRLDGVLGHSEGLKGIKGDQRLPRSLGFFGRQANLHHLLSVFHSLLFGKIEVPQNVEHTFVPALHERIK
jgi:hypothetical protein